MTAFAGMFDWTDPSHSWKATKTMWTALIARCLYSTQNVHYAGLQKQTACGAQSNKRTLILMSENVEHVTCRRCRNTWRFKLRT